MNTKLVAIAAGGVITVAALAMLFGGSDTEPDTAGPAFSRELADAGDTSADSRWGDRPQIFGNDSDERHRQHDAETTAHAGDRDRLGGRPGKPGALGRESTVAEGGDDPLRRERPELRDRLQGSSRPFEVADSGTGGNIARRPLGDTRHGEPPDLVDVIDDPDPDANAEGQPILSLFDGDDAAVAAAEAAVNRGVELDKEGAQFEPGDEYALPMKGKITGEAGTISFWVRPDGETADVDHASLLQLRSHYEWADRMQIWKDGGSVRMVFADSNGIETGAEYKSDTWAPGEWRLVTATWGDGENALYVNGELAGSAEYEGFKIREDTLLHVGSNYSEDTRSLNGTVSKFRVYDRRLEPEEIGLLPSEYPE